MCCVPEAECVVRVVFLKENVQNDLSSSVEYNSTVLYFRR